MILNKIVTGFVIQSFDTDTQKFVKQTFVAGLDDAEYETGDGDEINVTDFEDRVIGKLADLPLDMVQPV